ncbi:hypothetical protein FWKOB_10095 [Arcobacter sp. FWKO B]|nr:hypothetical protein FWKOB_10095 [Arcobacter sp. FWKO B]
MKKLIYTFLVGLFLSINANATLIDVQLVESIEETTTPTTSNYHSKTILELLESFYHKTGITKRWCT